MNAECCTQACDQGRKCPARQPMNEHRLTFIKFRSAAYIALGTLVFVALTSVRKCDEPTDHAAQAKHRMERVALDIERK